MRLSPAIQDYIASRLCDESDAETMAFRDGIESLALALTDKVSEAFLIEAVETAIEAFGNHG